MTTTIVKGLCDCGTEVERERAEGFGAELLNSLPLRCGECASAQEATWAAEDRAAQAQADGCWLTGKLENLPTALRTVRLDDLDTDGRAVALDAANRWAAGELRGFVLLGKVGVGKTTIAAAACRSYMVNHLHRAAPRWVNTVEALNNLSRGFTDPRRVDAMNALDGKESPLILDDLDKAKPNASAAAHLFSAIDNCVINRRALLVTTNLRPTQLAAYWPKPHGEAIASRLAGYAELHEISGPDRRWST